MTYKPSSSSSLFIILLLLIFGLGIEQVCGIDFTVTYPLFKTQHLLGSPLPIRWRMDNVTLPYDPSTQINVDLFLVRPNGEVQELMNLAEGVENGGVFEWWVPASLIGSGGEGYQVRISSPSNRIYNDNDLNGNNLNGEMHRAGQSATFQLVELGATKDDAVIITSPQRLSRVFADQTVQVSFSKGAALPSFPFGVHVELWSAGAGVALINVARNVSLTGRDVSFQWQVPSQPLSSNSISIMGEGEIRGKLVVWGWDENRQALVHGSNDDFIIDYTDQTILSYSFLSPAAGQILLAGSQIDMVLSIVEERTGRATTGRDTLMTMYLFDDQGRMVKQLFDGSITVKQEEWRASSVIVPWTVPSLKDLELPTSLLGEQKQHVFSGGIDERSYRILWEASYAAKQQGRRIQVTGTTPFFIIRSSNSPKRSIPGSAGRSSDLSSTAGVIAFCLYLLMLN